MSFLLSPILWVNGVLVKELTVLHQAAGYQVQEVGQLFLYLTVYVSRKTLLKCLTFQYYLLCYLSLLSY
jgi:hypothetical protein